MISLKTILVEVCKHWRRIIVVGIVFAALGMSYKGYRLWDYNQDAIGKESDATINHNENGANYELNAELMNTQIIKKSEYLNNTILSKIDFNNEGKAVADFTVSTPDLEKERALGEKDVAIIQQIKDEDVTSEMTITSNAERKASEILDAYKKYILYGMDWSELEEEFDTSAEYLRELVSVESGDTVVSATISVIYIDEDGAERILAYILNQLTAGTETISSEYEGHTLQITNQYTETVVDGTKFNWMNNRVTELNNLINNTSNFSSAAETLDDGKGSKSSNNSVISRKDQFKQIAKFGVAGFAGGVIFYLIIGVILLLISGYVLSAKNFNEYYGFDKLAVIPGADINNLKGLDRLFNKNRAVYWSASSDDVCFEIAAENINSLTNGNKVALVGDVDESTLINIKSKLNWALKDNIALDIICSLTDSAVDLQKLKNADSIVFVVKTHASTFPQCEKISEIIRMYKKNVLGSIVFD